MTTSTITPHAARAATEIAQQCGLFEHETECVELAVQRGIDAAIAELMETLRTHPTTVHTNVLRGQFLLTRAQALHIAGATDYDQFKEAIETHATTEANK